MNAIHRIASEGAECCRFYQMITNAQSMAEESGLPVESAPAEVDDTTDGLNESQREAVRRSRSSQVSLIWGPPGMNLMTSPDDSRSRSVQVQGKLL